VKQTHKPCDTRVRKFSLSKYFLTNMTEPATVVEELLSIGIFTRFRRQLRAGLSKHGPRNCHSAILRV